MANEQQAAAAPTPPVVAPEDTSPGKPKEGASPRKLTVRVQHKEGFPGIMRAGRQWVSNAPTQVEYVETDNGNDPQQEPGKTYRIGQKSLAMLKEDARVSLGVDELVDDGKEAERLRTENTQLKARVAELEKQLGIDSSAKAADGAEGQTETEQHHGRRGRKHGE